MAILLMVMITIILMAIVTIILMAIGVYFINGYSTNGYLCLFY